MELVTAKQLAAIRGCTPQNIYKEKVPKAKKGYYDLKNPAVREFLIAPYKRAWIKEQESKQSQMAVNPANSDLKEQLIFESKEFKKNQNKKLRLEYSIKKQELIPAKLMMIWVGYFASAVSTNFLNLGSRVARGDVKLRDKIEGEVKLAIRKTKEFAFKSLKKDGQNMIDELEGLDA